MILELIEAIDGLAFIGSILRLPWRAYRKARDWWELRRLIRLQREAQRRA